MKWIVALVFLASPSFAFARQGAIAHVQLPPSVGKKPVVEETVTVSSTRTGARLDDTPVRVEVLQREEIEEKMLMTPGDIVMLLNEMGGMRVQTTSPGIGSATVRVQGMRGRYTRFFSDGLPLFGDVGGIGLLQIPPMDLGQVEVIKGVASALYGAGAMGGVVNLISRAPADEAQREILINQSTRGATDLVGFFATPSRDGWSFTLLGGGHWQQQNDVNDDVWADLAGYSRGLVRPRVFWSNGRGDSFFATAGYTGERRTGGSIGEEILPAAGTPFVESLDTHKADAGFVAQILTEGGWVLNARTAVSHQRHDHLFGDARERDRHSTVFAEATMRRAIGAHVVVFGAAYEAQRYRALDLPQFDYTHRVPGAFAQADLELAHWLRISGSLRVDDHSAYGAFVSPRASALLRLGDWTARASIGTGFFGPTPQTEETEAAGLTRLTIPESLVAERGRSASVDVTRTFGPVTVTLTGFASRIQDPVLVDRSAGLVMTNADGPVTNAGIELVGTFRHEPWALTGTYAFVRSDEIVNGVGRDVALTPRHSVGLVAMWEREDWGRIGVECYVTGTQRLEENPYAGTSDQYVILGALVERKIGRFRLFVNAENLTGVRQTRYDPLVRPSRAPDGRWTVDGWAPLDGRNINGGVRISF